MSSLYNLIPTEEGFKFINDLGNQYYVYLTSYSLLDPKVMGQEGYINVFMFGFNCKPKNAQTFLRYDAKSKATIIFIFKGFLEQYPQDAFVYLCDNKDGMARNRRITFGKWFNENSNNHELHHSNIKYGKDNWYSAILIRKENANKQIYLDAYHYTIKQMLDDSAGS